jgi:hypothetical protein
VPFQRIAEARVILEHASVEGWAWGIFPIRRISAIEIALFFLVWWGIFPNIMADRLVMPFPEGFR